MAEDLKPVMKLFSDLIEGGRFLSVEVVAGTISFRLHGGRVSTMDTFYLDSELVDAFIYALRDVRDLVRARRQAEVIPV